MRQTTSRVDRFWMVIALGLVLPSCNFVQKECWISPSVLNEVTIRQLPAYNAIEAEVSGSLEDGWGKGFRQDARYLSLVQSPLEYPVLINLPEWENGPLKSTGTYYVQLILKDEPNYDSPREKGLSVVSFNSRMVACYAWQGPYTFEKFSVAVDKVRRILKQRGIPVAGPPRIALYTNPDWSISDWCLGEIQIPVPDKN
jgi:hypothetical protein